MLTDPRANIVKVTVAEEKKVYLVFKPETMRMPSEIIGVFQKKSDATKSARGNYDTEVIELELK